MSGGHGPQTGVRAEKEKKKNLPCGLGSGRDRKVVSARRPLNDGFLLKFEGQWEYGFETVGKRALGEGKSSDGLRVLENRAEALAGVSCTGMERTGLDVGGGGVLG